MKLLVGLFLTFMLSQAKIIKIKYFVNEDYKCVNNVLYYNGYRRISISYNPKTKEPYYCIGYKINAFLRDKIVIYETYEEVLKGINP